MLILLSYLVRRQMVARTVLETLRQVTDAPEDVEAVFAVVSRLAQDVGKLFYYFFFQISVCESFFLGGCPRGDFFSNFGCANS